jgi:copper(I)-binding protein
MTRRAVAAFVMLVCAVGASTACGGGTEVTDGALRVTEAWSRPTPPGVTDAAFYLTVLNGTRHRDRLIAVSSDRCAHTELHQSEVVDDMMQMRDPAPDDLAVGARDRLVLEPTGLHVMCLEVTAPLAAGERVDLTVTFERAGDRTVELVVKGR